jgi:glycerol-3-phosphate dehydrogenase
VRASLPDVPSALTAARRARDLHRLAEGWRPDVLVVGAGFTGCGVALDAATRGLSVAVLDRGDLASGTSRWSSKLAHGGLRYLGTGDVALARESAVERGVLMERAAPHLVRPLRFVTPLNAGMPPVVGALAGAGYLAGDLLRAAAGTRRATLPGPRLVRPATALRLAPAIGRTRLRGAWLNSDGQLVDDARLVVAVARTAAAFGAAVLPRVAANGVQRDRVEVAPAEGGTFTARAGRVVVAAGAWSDLLDDRVRLRPSKGVHLVLDGAALGHPSAAVAAPVPGSTSRFTLLLPQLDGRVLLGLTDDPVEGAVPEEPVVLASERAFLLDAVNRVLERPLADGDVVGAFAGYRPLVAGERGATADLSRAHLVLDDGDGPVTVVGGKLTTSRRMAEDVVDRLTDRPCRTRAQPLVGALPRTRLAGVRARRWLVARYGAEAVDLEALCAADPALAEPVVPGRPHLLAELAFGLLREGAATADDLLDRRTRIGLVPAERQAALPSAQQLVESVRP